VNAIMNNFGLLEDSMQVAIYSVYKLPRDDRAANVAKWIRDDLFLGAGTNHRAVWQLFTNQGALMSGSCCDNLYGGDTSIDHDGVKVSLFQARLARKFNFT
jgi:hypothetical protein